MTSASLFADEGPVPTRVVGVSFSLLVDAGEFIQVRHRPQAEFLPLLLVVRQQGATVEIDSLRIGRFAAPRLKSPLPIKTFFVSLGLEGRLPFSHGAWSPYGDQAVELPTQLALDVEATHPNTKIKCATAVVGEDIELSVRSRDSLLSRCDVLLIGRAMRFGSEDGRAVRGKVAP